MRIAVDLSFIRPDHKNGGTEAHIRNLMRGFVMNHRQNDFIFIIHRDLYEEYRKDYPELHFFTYRQRGGHAVRTVMFQTFHLPKLLRKLSADVIYFPTFQTGLHRHFSIPVVVNPHDIQYKEHPENFSFGKRIYFSLFYRAALKKADRVVGISEYVRETYKRAFGDRLTGKMRVLYNPIHFMDNNMDEGTNRIAGPYILSVNSLARHKNLITLLEAYRLLQEKRIRSSATVLRTEGDTDRPAATDLISNTKLVLIGAEWNSGSEISQYVKEHHLENRVVLTGYLKEEELAAYYRNAAVFVTPSLYEGFGMTPVEAMGMRIPVICSQETSLPEVTMGRALYYEPALDASRLAMLIGGVLSEIWGTDMGEGFSDDSHHKGSAYGVTDGWHLSEADKKKLTHDYLSENEQLVHNNYDMAMIADRYYHFICGDEL